LIINKGVAIFLFGSSSNFDYICHLVITELKNKYPYIIRKSYTYKSGNCILESKKKYLEEIYSSFRKEKVYLFGVEEEIEFINSNKYGCASYIEGNEAMINDGDYYVFYCNDKYLLSPRKYNKKSLVCYQPNSGTALAYKYAKQKN
jgi:hypothetical protein